MDSEVNSFAVNSNEIISECLKEYGKGELFLRADRREFEERRVKARDKYLASHPEIAREYREAITKAAITPGMTREQVIAAWGLFEEDTRTVFGHVAQDEHSAYAYFTGFAVRGLHALYLKDDVILGVRQTDELVSPHERELDMRRAEETGLFYFYDGNDGQLRGSNVDQYKMDWDTQHLRLYVIEIVPPTPVLKIKDYVRSKGLSEEYEAALLRLGYNFRTAPNEILIGVALSIIPYPRLRGGDVGEEPATAVATQLPDIPIALPSSATLPPKDPASMPPAQWISDVAEGMRQEVTFPTVNNQVEIVRVEWMRERLFRVEEVPLRVNGVSLYDLVEAEWRDGESTPHFKRVVENYGYRTVRAIFNPSASLDSILKFAKMNAEEPMKYRCEERILVLTVRKPGLSDFEKEWLDILQVTWNYTDTQTQD